MSIEVTAIHEASHAVALMAGGYAPTRMSVAAAEGFVDFPRGVDEEHAAIVGMAGGVAVQQILGVDADSGASASDFQFHGGLHAYGNRHSIDRMILSRADRLVAQYTHEIVDMANAILSQPSESKMTRRIELSATQIGDVVHATPSLHQFRHLFPRVESRRRQMVSHRPGEPKRTATPKMGASSYLQGRLLRGRGRMPANMTHGQVISNLRQFGGSR